jgi:beta-phosphoglucomutase-like phosphatase (HAD superfamily)
MHLVVFDIDGTLVDSGSFETELYVRAIKTVLQIVIEDGWNHYRNVTDGGILDQAMADNGIEGDRDEIQRRVKNEFINLTTRHLRNDRDALKEIAGARALIEGLSLKESVVLAIATGGWEETAKMKLHGAGIDPDRIAMTTGQSMRRWAFRGNSRDPDRSRITRA